MSHADKLRDLVDNTYPENVANLTTGIAAIDAQLTELNARKDAVEWGMGQAQSDQEARLAAKGYDLEHYGPNFGSTNLQDFWLYDQISVTGLTYVDVDTFDVDGDQTSVFTNGLEILADCGVDGKKQRIVSSSVYNGPTPDTTTVTLAVDAGANLTVNLASVYELKYEYLGTGWDSDANIVANIDYFDEAYEHLNEPLGTTGTYGINDKISKFGTAKTIQQADKAKYEALIVLYDRFAT